MEKYAVLTVKKGKMANSNGIALPNKTMKRTRVTVTTS